MPQLFLSGMTVACCVALAVFFLKSYKRNNDRLLLLFSFSFSVMAVNRIIMTFLFNSEYHFLSYVVRFLAFAIILIAIVDKNMQKSRNQI